MKKLLTLIALVFTLSSCTIASDRHEITVRNQTLEEMEIEIWLADVYFTLQSMQELHLNVRDEIKILTPYGLASEYEITDDNTIELHEEGYYFGEDFKSYWTEGR